LKKASVILTTYNAEEWLQKVLIGYSNQTEKAFELIIADDGSSEKTKNVIESIAKEYSLDIKHVWQEDNGFQKSKILNKAIIESSCEYLIFSDGDCIPRKDFIAQHIKNKEMGYFLSGGYYKLPLITSQKITKKTILNNDCFKPKWLLNNGLELSFKLTKLTQNTFFGAFMNWITPTKKTFNGHNSSCYKSDILAVNGFNEEMKYGGLDRELGERLFNYGILAKQIRYSAICVHLDHERSYATKENWAHNNAIRKYNKKHQVTHIDKGIIKK
jgi:glycosyltransferase involved in cell wall biosynthesis